ncbi:hypothetical protein [Paenibacillus sp. sgz500958]|uniref:hypothetical protein n=1 Tax=Paenibacillus sp. sgz500958 TaxID=3242475 RepID=UPI0036D23FFB
MFIVLLVAYTVIVLVDPYGLLKQGLKRDFYVCSTLCLISFSLAFAMLMHWNIPSPSPLIVNLVKRLY